MYYSSLILIIIWHLLSPKSTFAQKPNIKFDQITVSDGLSQSKITSIVQDSVGFMWFGSKAGLNRFDGSKIKIYKSDKNDSTSISDNSILNLFRDRLGKLWIITEEGGLNQYDSKTENFTQFKHNSADSNSISSNIARVLYEDRGGVLWVATYGGLNKYIHKQKKFVLQKIKNPGSNIDLSNQFIYCISEDSNGDLWLGTSDNGLIHFNKETGHYTHYTHNPKNPTSLSSNNLRTIFTDHTSTLWVGTKGGGLSSYNMEGDEFQHYKPESNDPYSINSNSILSIFEDSKHRLWIGTDGKGLNLYDRQNDRFYHYQEDINNNSSLSNDVVLDIYEDNIGDIWIATLGGINRINKEGMRFGHINSHPVDKNTLSKNEIRAIYEDRSGTLWVGTDRGGLNKIQNLNMSNVKPKYTHFNMNNHSGISDNVILSILEDKQGNMWFGTYTGGLNKYNKKTEQFTHFKHNPDDSTSISSNFIWSIIEDREGFIWLATSGGGINKFDPKTGKFKRFLNSGDPKSIGSNVIIFCHEDYLGQLWLGTYNRGLNLYEKETGQFKHYEPDPQNPNSISSKKLFSIYEDPTGFLWIGTDNGLNKLDPKTKEFTRFTEKDGIPNKLLFGVLGDNENNIWLSTNEGLYKYDIASKTAKPYTKEDGLQSNEFYRGAYHKGHSGKFYFGGLNGFNSFFPHEIKNNQTIPTIVLTDFQIYNKSVPIGLWENEQTILKQSITNTKKIEISYRENLFTLWFSALSFISPGKNRFAYKMEGFDKDWISIGERQYANYSNLEGGEYTFMVKGSNNDGVWNERPTTVKIIITPPFWKTTWFRFSSAFFLIVLLVGFYRQRVISIKKQNEKLEQQVKERTKEVIKGKKETDNILNNVEEGLFLINPDLSIGSQYSKSFGAIMEKDNLANRSFIDSISKHLPDNTLSIATEYFELMLDEKYDEQNIDQFSPLNPVEFSFENTENKFLSFKFKRIQKEDHTIEKLISTVKDITNQIHLENQLKKSEEDQKRQMEWLFNILQVEPSMLKEFIEGVKRELEIIEELLITVEDEKSIPVILESIYRSMHMIKGNAALLDLNFFVEAAHGFEESLSEIQQSDNLTYPCLNIIKEKHEEINKILNELIKLIDKIGNLTQNFKPKKNQEKQQLLKSIKNLIKSLSIDMGKKVGLESKNFDIEKVPHKYRLFVKEVLIQFIRNSMAHGIEKEVERKKSGKPDEGKIEIITSIDQDCFKFIYRDDGCGLKLEKLKEKAQELFGANGKKNLTEDDIYSVIFHSGVTTTTTSDHISGRGVGLDIVKSKIDEFGGIISINSKQGQFCEFAVELPIKEYETNKEEILMG